MTAHPPAFARDPATAAYYDQRAEEYDEWYLSQGRFGERDRPGWDVELNQVISLVRDLPTAPTVPGTGRSNGTCPGDRLAAWFQVTTEHRGL